MYRIVFLLFNNNNNNHNYHCTMPFKYTSNRIVYHRGIPANDPSFSFWVSINYNTLKQMQRADPNYIRDMATAYAQRTQRSLSATTPASSSVVTMQFF